MTSIVLDEDAIDPRWSIAGVFLEALARRDFDEISACLVPTIRFRALAPEGPLEICGASETVAQFQRWFDGHEVFEVIDASIGQLGAQVYLRWRILRAATACENDSRQIVEQHVFASIVDRIETLDLLCSGFNAEHPGASRASGGSCGPTVHDTDGAGVGVSVLSDSRSSGPVGTPQ